MLLRHLPLLLLVASGALRVRCRDLDDDELCRLMHVFEPAPTSRAASASFKRSLNEISADSWRTQAQSRLSRQLGAAPILGPAKNVILFLGDGMSVATLTAARILKGQRRGLPGEGEQLSFEGFPHAGLSKTYCVDSQVADSACTSTAYLCGVKTNIGTLGVTAAVSRGDCRAQNDTSHHVDSILKWAQEAGMATGVVTTVTVTHASPAGGYAHAAERNWESDADVRRDGADPAVCPDIAAQLVTRDPGRGLQVILGGGRTMFLPNTTVDEEGVRGRRWDGRHLLLEWATDKDVRGASAAYVTNRDQLLAVDAANTDYLLGLFKPSFMSYHLDADHATEPRLKEMTEVAIKVLQRNKNGYVLFVEGGLIDTAHHSTHAHKALDETIEFSEAVGVADRLTDERDTLIAVTADHSHTMTISGYPPRGNHIFGVAGRDLASMPYLTLGYANGPKPYKNPKGRRWRLADEDTNDKSFQFPAMVHLWSETHGGEDVAVMSRGPGAYLLSGVFEQNYIPHAMAYAACIGHGRSFCKQSGA